MSEREEIGRPTTGKACKATGERMRRARLSKGWTLRQAAGKLDVSQETLWNWESAITEPRLSQFLSLARTYECNPTELIGGQ